MKNEKRIKVKVRSTGGNPHGADVEISLDGEVVSNLAISRVEVVVDADNTQSYLRLDFPTFELDIEDDALDVQSVSPARVERLRQFLKVVDEKD